jgi:hypothetical protein
MERRFTQEELKAAYEQMVKERNREYEYAKIAARILNNLFKKQKEIANWLPDKCDRFRLSSDTYSYHPDYLPRTFRLAISLCDYDDWSANIKFLEGCGVKMQQWDGNSSKSPTGIFDLTDCPDFPEEAPQKSFEVYITYYNSHEGGY